MMINEAICELRQKSGQSQQVFATGLGLSLRALQRYEQGSSPDARALIRLMALAEDAKLPYLCAVFRQGLIVHLGMPGWKVNLQLQKVEERYILSAPPLRWPRKDKDKGNDKGNEQ